MLGCVHAGPVFRVDEAVTAQVLAKHSRLPRKLSRRTLRRREQEAIGGVHSLSEVNPQSIVQRYIAGEKIKDMAHQYGVSRIAMYHFLLRHVPEDWMAAQKAKAFAMKEQGEELITDAADPLELGKGREQLRAGQWDLERVDRKNYGRDEQLHVTFDIAALDERLRRARERVIESRTAQVIDIQTGSPASMNDRAGAHAVMAGELQASAGIPTNTPINGARERVIDMTPSQAIESTIHGSDNK